MLEPRSVSELPLVFGYIDPGTGFVLVGTVLPYIYAAVAAVVAALLWPLRTLARKLTRWRHGIRPRRVVLLGFDGMDPQLAERWMDEGKLPNLERLRAAGGYQRLPTTTPSACAATVRAISGVDTPNPATTGTGLLTRTRSRSPARFSGSWSLAPVTPVTVM